MANINLKEFIVKTALEVEKYYAKSQSLDEYLSSEVVEKLNRIKRNVDDIDVESLEWLMNLRTENDVNFIFHLRKKIGPSYALLVERMLVDIVKNGDEKYAGVANAWLICEERLGNTAEMIRSEQSFFGVYNRETLMDKAFFFSISS